MMFRVVDCGEKLDQHLRGAQISESARVEDSQCALRWKLFVAPQRMAPAAMYDADWWLWEERKHVRKILPVLMEPRPERHAQPVLGDRRQYTGLTSHPPQQIAANLLR
jgi:hypothetical protein